MSETAVQCRVCEHVYYDGQVTCTCLDDEAATYVRYGIVSKVKTTEDVLVYIPYEEEAHAHEARKAADKRNKYHAPHRVVKATITLEEVES